MQSVCPWRPCSCRLEQHTLLLSTEPTSGVGDAPSPALIPAIAPRSASEPEQAGAQAQERCARGYHHFGVIPCKLTRCLAALPARVPASPPSLMPEPALLPCLLLTFHLLFQHTGSPQHLPNLALPPHRLLNASRSCPSPQRSHSSWPSHTAVGWHSPCQTTPQGPLKAMGE